MLSHVGGDCGRSRGRHARDTGGSVIETADLRGMLAHERRVRTKFLVGVRQSGEDLVRVTERLRQSLIPGVCDVVVRDASSSPDDLWLVICVPSPEPLFALSRVASIFVLQTASQPLVICSIKLFAFWSPAPTDDLAEPRTGDHP